jgi:hypothetical protein
MKVNRVLRRIFGSKRDEVTGDWRKLHNEELHNLYSSTNVIRMIKARMMTWTGHVARMGKKRNSCRILVGKPDRIQETEKRPKPNKVLEIHNNNNNNNNNHNNNIYV